MSAVHEAIIAVLADLPAIGKNQRNTQQNFSFRGIDDVLNALNPILAKHGLFYVPHVIERTTNERATRSGGVMYEVNLHVEYTFYASDGSYVSASGWGEGTDSGDKATSKAMTMAMKYVLFQVFAISTEEASHGDSDRSAPEETTGRGRAANQPTMTPFMQDVAATEAGWGSEAERREVHEKLAAQLKGTALGETMKAYRVEHKIGWPMTSNEFDQFMTFLEAAKAELELGSLDDIPEQPAQAEKPVKKAAAKKAAK